MKQSQLHSFTFCRKWNISVSLKYIMFQRLRSNRNRCDFWQNYFILFQFIMFSRLVKSFVKKNTIKPFIFLKSLEANSLGNFSFILKELHKGIWKVNWQNCSRYFFAINKLTITSDHWFKTEHTELTFHLAVRKSLNCLFFTYNVLLRLESIEHHYIRILKSQTDIQYQVSSAGWALGPRTSDTRG